MTSSSPPSTTSCPFCGEEILSVAVKCKHCQSALSAPAVTPPATSAPRAQGDGHGTVLLLAPWVGVALLWLWVGESPLFKASDNLLTVVGLVVVGTAIVAAIDANALGSGVKGTPAEKATGPGGTFASVLLLWFLMYPVHMHERAKYGGRARHTWAAVFGMLAFVASAGYLGTLINDKLDELRQAFGR